MDADYRISRYGMKWAPLASLAKMDPKLIASGQIPDHVLEAWYDFHIERTCLALPEGQKPPEFEGFLAHGKRMSRFLWGDPHGLWYFEFNPNSEEIIQRFDRYKWLGISGCKNSGKTESIVWLSLMFFLIDPDNSKVLIGSKTIETALGKIWASVDLAWRQASVFFGGEHAMPGEMVASKAFIRSRTTGRKSGLEVIPGEQNSVKKSAEKLQGYKAGGWRGRLMFATDETATMSHAIINTAISNLTGNEGFKGVGGFNPEDENDPARPLAEPVGGFSSISVNDTGWATKLGWCCHFDGEKSPNVIAGRNADGKYPWRGLYTRENLREDTKFYVDKSAHYWKMVRGFWAPTGSDECIYSSPEIRSYGGEGYANFLNPPVPVSGCDPAYKHDGDRAVQWFGLLGDVTGPRGPMKCLQLTEMLVVAEDVEVGMDKDEQVARQCIKECKERGVRIEHFAYDETGAGISWGSLVRLLWGPGALGVPFGGAPTDLPVPDTDGSEDDEGKLRPANEKYANRVSEIWHIGKYLLRSGQLKGITPDLAAEMIVRNYKESAGKVKVESKKEMKKRTQKSPDISDSAFILVALCRQRLGLVPTERAAKIHQAPKSTDEFPLPGLRPAAGTWRKAMERFNINA